MNTSIKFLKRNSLWVLFIVFAFLAIMTREEEFIFKSQGPYSFGKYFIWIIFFCFLGYSIYCSGKENFFNSVSRISRLLWGRQIGIDLYIGLILSLVIIYLNGGINIFLVWLLPVLVYANLATLMYLALNYDSLINQFIMK